MKNVRCPYCDFSCRKHGMSNGVFKDGYRGSVDICL